MERKRRELLEELAARGREHDAELADRLQRLRNVETETAQMMNVLVRSLRAQRLLELGTSNGYSTLWLGDAAAATGGRLLSVDVDAQRTAMAQRNLEEAALDGVVELRTQDAGAALAEQPSATADFVFLDAERAAYVDYWQDLVRVLALPGLLVVDNVVSHAQELAEFTGLADSDGRVTSAAVPIGAGVLLVSRGRRPVRLELDAARPRLPFRLERACNFNRWAVAPIDPDAIGNRASPRRRRRWGASPGCCFSWAA